MGLSNSTKAKLILLFLSPISAELVSGSTPLLLFIQPIVLLTFLGYYGAAVLIIREINARWHKGYVSLFILGMAYGIIEEGLTIRSFFSTTWPDLGILATYGRWAGVNWVWAVSLTLIHAVISISVPIFIVDLMYPELKGKSLIGNTGLVILSLIFIADALFLILLIPAIVEPIPYISAIIIVILLGVIAYKIPPQFEFRGSKPLLHSSIYFAVMTFWSVFQWMIFDNMPYLNLHPIITISFGVLLYLFVYQWLRLFNWNSDLPKIWSVVGVYSFFFFIDFLLEFVFISPTEPGHGMAFVAIGFFMFLMYVRRKIKARN